MRRSMLATVPKVAGDYKITTRDLYQISTSILMTILGTIILFRSLIGNIALMPLLVGGGFLALGCYRIKFIVRFFKERRRWKHI